MSILTKIHAAEDEYPEVLLNDPGLTWSSKGLYMSLSRMAHGCPVRLSDLTERGCDGIDAVRRGLLELRLFGYLRKTEADQHARRRSHLLMAAVPLFGVDPLAFEELMRDLHRKTPRHAKLDQFVCANFANILRQSRFFRAVLPAASEIMECYGVPAYDREYSSEMLRFARDTRGPAAEATDVSK